ncbi:Hsp70 family protein [Embleya sp. NBC_00888]|uniref:Hsp70 family protein n=1 Tax=Embleya sp. NBC_00888 TaxID=2975960 RepID=UPI003867E41C|nr:Hsp70 family protein [Embleya sp. NBC_00888]
MQRTLGIDLGTTNSVAAWLSNGVPVVLANRLGGQATASAVGIDSHGALLVGSEALNWLAGEPGSVITEVKRLIGRRWDDELVQQVLEARPDDAPPVRESADGSVEIRLGGHYLSPVQVSAILLRRLKQDAESAAGAAFRRAVITVPAYFAEPQINAVREAGRLAGFHVARIVPEPTAAAHAFGVRSAEQGGTRDHVSVLVFDLGGGTFDVSLLTIGPGYFSVDALSGDNLLGGADFDALLDKHLREQIGGRDHSGEGDASRIRTAAERVKIELSAQDVAEVTLAPLGRQGGSWSGSVPRTAFEGLLSEHVRRMRETVESMLKAAGALPGDVQHVLLVGGSTHIPAVRRELKDLFGDGTVSHAVDPMLAVAHGAAVEAGLLDTLDCPAVTCTTERIPATADACPECATSLLGAPTVDCPGCHVPAPEGSAGCAVCAADLSGMHAVPPAVTRTECSECGRDDNPASATVCLDCDAPLDSGGLECPGCGMVNAAGLGSCSFCDGAFGTALAQQVTAQDIGLELADGTVEVLFPRGTPYPTEWQRVDTLVVRGDRSGPVRFHLWEGPHTRSAHRNEFCGSFAHERADGFSGDVPLTLEARLDVDRTIDLKVRIGSGGWHGAQLNRTRVLPAVSRKASELHYRCVDFLKTWDKEITSAERDALTDALADLAALGRGEPLGRSLDGVLDSARDTLELCEQTRNAGVRATIAARYGRGLLPQSLLDRLRKAGEAVGDARRAMDVKEMQAAAEQAEDLWTGLDPAIRTAILTIRLAEQDSYPTTLRKEILAARDALRDAVEYGDQDAQDSQLVHLGRLAERGRDQCTDVVAASSAGGVMPSRR